MRSRGYTGGDITKGGYETWKHADGRKVDIKPSGEVIPSRRVWTKDGSRKYYERTDWWGNRLEDQSHSTGHFVK